MEKKTATTTRNAARHAAKPAGASGERGKTGAAQTRSGGQSGAHAAKRGASTGKRRPQKRRRGGRRSNARNMRLWIILGAGALVIVLAVVLALTLPMGKDKGDAAPASADAGVEEDVLTDAMLEEDAGTVATEDGGDVEAPPEDASVYGDSIADAPEAGDAPDGLEDAAAGDGEAAPIAESDGAAEASGAESDGAAEASGAAIVSSDSEIVSQLSPEMLALMQKYKVLDGIPNTAEPLGIPEGARAEDSYFDDALFVGDSVTLKLQRYVASQRKGESPTLLGSARFLAAQSFSARNALMKVSEKSIHPVIEGEKMTLEDAIAKLAPKKLYLMLGMNDVGVSGLEGALENMSKLLGRIREKCPDMRIIVESATPRLKGTHPTTNQLFAFDVRLYDAILNMNDPMIEFIDIAYAMRDAEGKLVEEYCDDPNNMAIHFTNAGCRQWIDYLYTHPSTAA